MKSAKGEALDVNHFLASSVRDAKMTMKKFLIGRVKRGVGRGFEKRVNNGPTLKF